MTARPAHTPRRTVRVPDERWEPALTNTRANGTTVTAVINEALDTYNKSHGDSNE